MKMKEYSQEKCFLPFPRKVSQEFWSIKQGRQKKKKKKQSWLRRDKFSALWASGWLPRAGCGPLRVSMNRTGWAWEGVKEELADKRAGFQVELACQAWAGLELEPGQAGAREVHCRMVRDQPSSPLQTPTLAAPVLTWTILPTYPSLHLPSLSCPWVAAQEDFSALPQASPLSPWGGWRELPKASRRPYHLLLTVHGVAESQTWLVD